MKKSALAVATLVLSCLAPLWAQPSLSPQSKLWLIGDSSLHVYESTATTLNASLSFKPGTGTLLERLKNNGLEKLDVAVPVKDMRSGKGALDKNMQKALKAQDNPDITFHMQSYRVLSFSDQKVELKAAGALKIAGVEQTVELDGTASAAGGKLEILGKKALLMTDYGVKPPSILGLVKTRNEVTVYFDLIINPE
jgi:polyisoprenoid-binding protein YceI